MSTIRKYAIAWWNDLTHNARLYYIKKYKDSLLGSKDRHPNTLTGREIQSLFLEREQNESL